MKNVSVTNKAWKKLKRVKAKAKVKTYAKAIEYLIDRIETLEGEKHDFVEKQGIATLPEEKHDIESFDSDWGEE